MINILGKRYLFFGISLLIIIPGLILAILGLPLSIDFTGGSLLEVKFENGTAPQPADIITIYNNLGIKDVQVQTTNQGIAIARSSELAEGLNKQIEAEMGTRFPDLGTVTEQRFESVGATVGKEVARRAAEVVAIAAVGVSCTYGLPSGNCPMRCATGCAPFSRCCMILVSWSLSARSAAACSAGKWMPCS